jgi:hypothetical protein
MKRLKLVERDNIHAVKCDGYECFLDCPICSGGRDLPELCGTVSCAGYVYNACATALVWAEFYGLY